MTFVFFSDSSPSPKPPGQESEANLNHQKFQVPKMEVLIVISYKAILGVGFPLHKTCIQLI